MKHLKKLLSAVLTACLLAGLLPYSAAAGNTLDAGEGQTYSNLEEAIAAASFGDTISLHGTVYINDDGSNSAPWVIDKAVTIEGGVLSLRSGGIVLGADVTFRDTTIALTNRVRNAIIANGYTLTLDGVSQDTSTNAVHLFCGGITGLGPGGIPQPGNAGTIRIQGSTRLGNIYAGSLSSDGSGNSSDIPAVIEIADDASGSTGSIYACGALETPVPPEEMMNPNYVVAPPTANPSAYPVLDKVEIRLYNSVAKSIDGETGGSSAAAVVFDGSGDLASPSLSDIGSLSVKSGTLQPSALRFSGDSANMEVASNAQLDLSQTGDLEIQDFSGGGKLVLGQSQTLTINGNVDGTTQIGIGSIRPDGTSDLIGAERVYITAPSSAADSFSFQPYPTQPNWEFRRDADGNWQTAQTGEIDNLVGSLRMDDLEVDLAALQEDVSIPLLLTPEDNPPQLDSIPLDYEVNGRHAVLTDDDPIISELNLCLYVADNQLYVYNLDFDPPPAGVYHITLTVPPEHTVSGQELKSSVTLTVKNGDDPVPVPVPQAVGGLTANGTVQTGVPEGTGYSLTGHRETAAGNYIATATLAPGYMWSDGSQDEKQIPWSIAEADPEPTDPPGAPTGLAGTAPTRENGADGKITGTSADMEYAGTENATDWIPCTGPKSPGWLPAPTTSAIAGPTITPPARRKRHRPGIYGIQPIFCRNRRRRDRQFRCRQLF